MSQGDLEHGCTRLCQVRAGRDAFRIELLDRLRVMSACQNMPGGGREVDVKPIQDDSRSTN